MWCGRIMRFAGEYLSAESSNWLLICTTPDDCWPWLVCECATRMQAKNSCSGCGPDSISARVFLNRSMGAIEVGEVRHIEVVQCLIHILDTLGIPYALGGSMASSTYGMRRFTQDDITVKPFSSVADKFYEMVKGEFYISEQAMRHALSTHGGFNVIHFETSFKIDLFVQGSSEFEQQLLVRSRKVRLTESNQKDVCIVSPEDIILLKLRWFAMTGGTSERQWNDVLGVLGVQGQTLDYAYLTHWARELGLNELLDRAIAEAGT